MIGKQFVLDEIPTTSIDNIGKLNRFSLASSHRTLYWYPTFQAALYCAIRSGRQDLDWHSILLENRRQQVGEADLELNELLGIEEDTGLRGNAHRYGRLNFTTLGNKPYYPRSALNIWLNRIVRSGLLPVPTVH